MTLHDCWSQCSYKMFQNLMLWISRKFFHLLIKGKNKVATAVLKKHWCLYFLKDFHCKVGNFRNLKYLAKISSIIEKNPPKIKILYKPSPKHFILGYFKLFHAPKPNWLNSFFCSLIFHQCIFKTAVQNKSHIPKE